LAFLHRSLGVSDDSAAQAVPNARIEVSSASGAVFSFNSAPDSVCVVPRSDSRGIIQGSCYRATTQATILPGQTYSLRIQLADGGVMVGTTHVPGDFTLIRPIVATCALAANQTLPIQWTRSDSAWVYESEATLRGIRALLANQGVKVKDDPWRLYGLSASSSDTVVIFPRDLGLFQRFDENQTLALIAIEGGLPSGTIADVIIGSADRNYVNWERGGDFNPSGQVRVASIRGAGSGVFASMVTKSFRVRVGATNVPPC
jgi:hypothetical protein